MKLKTTKNETVIILIVAILAFIRPTILTTILSTIPGRAIFILLLVYATFRSTVLGIALVFLFVYMRENVVEGLDPAATTTTTTTSETTTVPYKHPILSDEKYKNRCMDISGNKLFKDMSGNVMTDSTIGLEFPDLRYTSGKCNICDSKCVFSLFKAMPTVTTSTSHVISSASPLIGREIDHKTGLTVP